MAKLDNTGALRKLLDGTHKSQTRTTIGFSDAAQKAEKNKKREVGERWTDSEGVVWEQRAGYRVKGVDRADRMGEIRKYLEADKCPECDEKMSKRLDKKYFALHRKCMDCVIDFEHQLRKEGKYEEYQNNKMKENALSWLRDAEKEKEVLKEMLCKTEYINSDGSIETWELPYDPEEMKIKIDNDFEALRKELLSQYGVTDGTGNTTNEKT